MTAEARPGAVAGRFDQRLTADGVTYELSRRGDEYWVRTDDGEARRVVMTTGSHHMQAYWTAGERGNELVELPFTWLIEDQRWVGRKDVFLIGPDYPKGAAVWNRTCIECHATGGQPRDRDGVPESRVGELGIACESCHGPGHEHVAANLNPARRYVEHLGGSGDEWIVNPARLRKATRQTQVCGQCHGITCNDKDWAWRGLPFRPGDDLERVKPIVQLATLEGSPCKDRLADAQAVDSRYWKDGMVRVSGREYNGLAASACARGGEISCLSCHSMHDSDPDGQVKQGGGCVSCHAGKKGAAHTHHADGSSGSSCENCHMPHTVYGLLKAIRSHLIDSPDVAKTIATGRPDACSQCHLDRSQAWVAERLASWYGVAAPAGLERAVPAAVRDALAGDAGQRALAAWSMGWADAQGRGGMAPFLAILLDDPYTAVRYIAARSLRRLPGWEDLAYDHLAPPEERRAASARARARAGVSSLVDDETIERLRRARDDRQMFLAE
jgi:hypothetical protein